MFPADHLPEKVETYSCGFIANTDPSRQPGTHWATFHFPSKEGEFFDSYGQSPARDRKSFEDFLQEHSYEREFNTHKLQVLGQMYVDNIVYFTLV